MYKARECQRAEDIIVHLVEAEIRISERGLHKILEELLDNALKFSKPGTPIHITTQLVRDQFTLSIQDQGRGISQAQIAHIGAYMQFERHRYEQQGSGLGLIISRLLAPWYGGDLSIDSKENQGTTVTVAFRHNHGISNMVSERS